MKNLWTEKELSRLRKYADLGLTSKEAAKKLGRSWSAVRFKAADLEIRFGRK